MPTSSFDKKFILNKEGAKKLAELLTKIEKGDVMNNVIKQIRKILGNHESSHIYINIVPNEIWFEIYETKIPIIVDTEIKEVYLDCETCDNHLSADMLEELGKIVKLLEDNIDEIISILD